MNMIRKVRKTLDDHMYRSLVAVGLADPIERLVVRMQVHIDRHPRLYRWFR